MFPHLNECICPRRGIPIRERQSQIAISKAHTLKVPRQLHRPQFICAVMEKEKVAGISLKKFVLMNVYRMVFLGTTLTNGGCRKSSRKGAGKGNTLCFRCIS